MDKKSKKEEKKLNPKKVPEVNTTLRKNAQPPVPSLIRDASGISIFGRRLKSFIFTTDVATICYTDADAIMAVYPQTPHPAIIEAITTVSSQPVFAGVGGGTTAGMRSATIAQFAEARGAMGIVVNAPTSIETIALIESYVDCPIIATIVSNYDDIQGKLDAGVDVLNVANGKETPDLVRWIRKRFPEIAIIATGGTTEESIEAVIEAGANAVSWTPISNADLFKEKMVKYRQKKRQTYLDAHDGLTLHEYEAFQKKKNN